jgi:hypothetical protein
VTVFATAVIDNSSRSQVTSTEINTLTSIIKSKDHLNRNIKFIDYRLIGTQHLGSGKFNHSLQVEMDVDTLNLWENDRSYLHHHLGKDTWTLQDGTFISLIRIHQKR